MFKLESQWVYRQSVRFASNANNLIDIGSDSEDYRNNTQSYIARMYTKLKSKGINIKTLDMDPATTPDFVEDICRPLKLHERFDIVLALNVLEHLDIRKIHAAIDNFFLLANDDGIVVITVPYNLPRHNRPIDNLLRPNPKELIRLVGADCLFCEQWEDEHYREPYISNPSLAPRPIVTGGVFRGKV